MAPAKIKVAIIGGGPAGLAAAIELSKRPFVDWTLYEKKPVISEIGNGLTIQLNTWRMLTLMGAANSITTDDLFRPGDEHYVQHRNGETAQLLAQQFMRKETPSHQIPCRAHRAVLQHALLKKVDQSRIQIGRKLLKIVRQPNKKLGLRFDGGLVDEVDLLVGADGIRSVVRKFAFPEHSIRYTGSTAYRSVVRTSDALKINGLPKAVLFWHGVDGKWVYTCPLGGNDMEVTAKVKELGGEERVSWGREASVQKLREYFQDFAPPIRQLLDLVSSTQQFDFFAGPHLSSVIQHGSIALIGDASHPLSGAFGAGAGFALEDAYVLGSALEWAASAGRSFADGLKLFDQVRSPHYSALYKVLDEFGSAEERLSKTPLPPAEEIQQRVASVWDARHNWMYYYQVSPSL
ncbi:FAD/NAD(P)-binding domain-containing protein [Thozetella sp. PMI_491]|nr:FAD/NAD(P)-binding domain-containing protein [Thozetella sp. PMI_491]